MTQRIRLLKDPVAITVLKLGRKPYHSTLELQQTLAQRLKHEQGAAEGGMTSAKAAEDNKLLLVEHDPPVYTVGRQHCEDDFLVPIHELQQRGCHAFKTGRGGAVTWHGPGQLVGYPILNLSHFNPSVRWYVHALEEVLVRTLSQFGLKSHTTSDVGVWIDGQRKIAAIGVAVSRWVTMHGFALNVCPDLSYYDAIIPCRIRDKEVTSMAKELGRDVTVEQVTPVLLDSFSHVFGNTWK